MRTRICKRHNCDFCGKGSFFMPTMENHEKKCTANPARICGMCLMAGIEQKSIAELDSLLTAVDFTAPYAADKGSENERVIRKATQGCPACILAVLRQSKKEPNFSIDWKKESKAWLDTHGEDRTDYGHY